MATDSDKQAIKTIGCVLNNQSKPLKERFRALFTLKNIGGSLAIDSIAACFTDPSELLKHECAYCLGQMQDVYAIPSLVKVLEDVNQQPIVRHEAGEALGAIGSADLLDILQRYATDPVVEVAETCELAVQRIKWLENKSDAEKDLPANPYASVDPAPPSATDSIENLRQRLLDENLPLFERYRAMFTLRNNGDRQSAIALAEGLKCKSALFRHEIAYVLGQMANDACIQQLKTNLTDLNENCMVRHECAEALGAIATAECMEILEDYARDNERVVKESCEVALDMCEYANSEEFQYADALAKIDSMGTT